MTRMQLPTFAQIGTPGGHPILLFHGWPGSLLQRPTDRKLLRRAGVRLITMDRPGMGSTPFREGRTLLSWPQTVEALADHLGLETFSVVGVSAGGPYALACAFAIPRRLRSVALVGAMAPLDPLRGALPWHQKARLLYTIARSMPWVLPPPIRLFRHYLRRADSPIPRWVIARLPDSDRRAFCDRPFRRMLLGDFRRAFQQGPRGAIEDARILASPWGFDLSAITMPIHLWHGTADTVVPPPNARYLLRQLPNAIPHWMRGLGHYGLVHQGIGPILRSLVG